jgi:hypothetical protein
MNKRGEPKNIERFGNVRIIDSNTGVAFVIEEEDKKPMNNQVRIMEFIEEFKKLQEKYKMQVESDDPFCTLTVRDQETGKEYDMDGESY